MKTVKVIFVTLLLLITLFLQYLIWEESYTNITSIINRKTTPYLSPPINLKKSESFAYQISMANWSNFSKISFETMLLAIVIDSDERIADSVFLNSSLSLSIQAGFVEDNNNNRLINEKSDKISSFNIRGAKILHNSGFNDKDNYIFEIGFITNSSASVAPIFISGSVIESDTSLSDSNARFLVCSLKDYYGDISLYFHRIELLILVIVSVLIQLLIYFYFARILFRNNSQLPPNQQSAVHTIR